MDDHFQRMLEPSSDDIDEETIKRILQVADKQQDVVELDLPGVKKLFLGLERRIQANLLKRVKFADEPAKFLESELELYEEIGQFKAVAAAPSLYPELVKLDVANTLLGLVTHENTDISISMLGCLAEMTDPDVVLEAEKEAGTLLDALVEKNGLELVVQNLKRLDESREEDVRGVNYTLQLIENLVTVRPSLAPLICEKTSFLRVLLTRVKAKRFDDVKAYCAELLSILLAADTENQRRLGQLADINGMDTLLQAIAYYRRRDASCPEEKECIENLFDALCSCLLLPENQARFRQSEGLDLLLRCIREKKGGFLGALKALDSACLNSVPNCEKLIELGGLKTLFPLYMGRGWGVALKGKRPGEREALTEQVHGGGEGGKEGLRKHEVEEARLLGKFVEGGGEKVDRAVELFIKYQEKVRRARLRLNDEGAGDWEEGLGEQGETAEEKGERRMARLMDAGLFMLQRVAVILGFVYSRDA
ncbi:beta-catenin-like protein 1 [Nannochloropsis gaditana CCMP526]|uniref:beta-catenin-like protein 1 n=1 Tax=Nannochloropsis gaditana (strain CCMP526) TaxID=1093141 RepID=UPI00029F7844|nr:beta-catenin-like protein 1 [Nannochloropsis gaditana CCMP526]EKU22723.1 beta-catenin-like protein 1 [Nannochloropsis gaditana CCMP526]|eukprot:XP_005853636.1 beta-catenin-like protein 1 [Nannochloropsis gaditana CCMP526]